MTRKLLSLLFCLTLMKANAGGFQLNLQGQKQTGMGHTGTGLCLDNASVLFNPGALAFLDSVNTISFGGSFILPRTVYLEPYPGQYKANTVNHTGTPITLYVTHRLSDSSRWTVSLGVYNPFGSRVEWQDNWKGQFLIREIDLKTFFIQPGISYKVSENIGIGAGFILATGDFALRKAIPIQDTLGNYGEGKLYGKASGYGFNAGIYYKANDKLSFGFDYRSSVKVKVTKGTADFKVPASVADYFPSTTFSTELNLPSTISIGAGYKLNKNVTLALDVNFVGWKSYDSLIIDFNDNTDKLKDIHSAREYQNTYIIRLGMQYHLSDKWTLRAGGYFDKSPVKAGYLTPETPDADKIAVSCGASLKLTKRLKVDASLLYIEGKKRTDTNIETQFGGTYKTKAVVPGIGLSYSF